MRPSGPQKTDQLCRNPKPCSYGDRCIFAHNMEEQRRFREAYGGGQGNKQVGAGTVGAVRLGGTLGDVWLIDSAD